MFYLSLSIYFFLSALLFLFPIHLLCVYPLTLFRATRCMPFLPSINGGNPTSPSQGVDDLKNPPGNGLHPLVSLILSRPSPTGPPWTVVGKDAKQKSSSNPSSTPKTGLKNNQLLIPLQKLIRKMILIPF